jgi:hypothetical protein
MIDTGLTLYHVMTSDVWEPPVHRGCTCHKESTLMEKLTVLTMIEEIDPVCRLGTAI